MVARGKPKFLRNDEQSWTLSSTCRDFASTSCFAPRLLFTPSIPSTTLSYSSDAPRDARVTYSPSHGRDRRLQESSHESHRGQPDD